MGVQDHVPHADLLQWLTPHAVLRVLFFGSARNKGVGVTYVPYITGNPVEKRRECYCCGGMVPHVDPHDCSAACMSMQLDTCSFVCGCYEQAARNWRGIIKLSDANAFSPDPSWLGFPIIALLSGTVNYELIFLLANDEPSAIMRVQTLSNTLIRLYRRVWGRSELRIADPNGGADLRGLHHERARRAARHQRHPPARPQEDRRAAQRQLPGAERCERHRNSGARKGHAARNF